MKTKEQAIIELNLLIEDTNIDKEKIYQFIDEIYSGFVEELKEILDRVNKLKDKEK